jgi:hypothetical protein
MNMTARSASMKVRRAATTSDRHAPLGRSADESRRLTACFNRFVCTGSPAAFLAGWIGGITDCECSMSRCCGMFSYKVSDPSGDCTGSPNPQGCAAVVGPNSRESLPRTAGRVSHLSVGQMQNGQPPPICIWAGVAYWPFSVGTFTYSRYGHRRCGQATDRLWGSVRIVQNRGGAGSGRYGHPAPGRPTCGPRAGRPNSRRWATPGRPAGGCPGCCR